MDLSLAFSSCPSSSQDQCSQGYFRCYSRSREEEQKAPAFPRRLRENDEFGSESKNISDAQSRSEDVWVPTYEPSELPLFNIAVTLAKATVAAEAKFTYI